MPRTRHRPRSFSRRKGFRCSCVSAKPRPARLGAGGRCRSGFSRTFSYFALSSVGIFRRALAAGLRQGGPGAADSRHLGERLLHQRALPGIRIKRGEHQFESQRIHRSIAASNHKRRAKKSPAAGRTSADLEGNSMPLLPIDTASAGVPFTSLPDIFSGLPQLFPSPRGTASAACRAHAPSV